MSSNLFYCVMNTVAVMWHVHARLILLGSAVDGLWEMSNCSILNNIKDACVVVSNFGQAHFKECEIGGLRQARSHHGLIQVMLNTLTM